MILIDTNVLLDILQNDPVWAEWSQQQLETASLKDTLAINAVIYSELSLSFSQIEEFEEVLAEASITLEPIPREALFLAGKAFLNYRRQKGTKQGVLPDFYIGAHAAIEECPLITRDASRVRTYFPTVKLITPE